MALGQPSLRTSAHYSQSAMDAAGQHAPEEEGYSKGLMVPAGLLTLLIPGVALISALVMFLVVRENQRKRAQLKKWLLASAAVMCAIVLYVVF
jgi:hypothetical protein